MKKITLIVVAVIISGVVYCQTSYYKGEWSTAGGTSYYTGIFKITVKDNLANGAFYWTYYSCDSSRTDLVEFMKGKRGKSAIEYVDGTYERGQRYFIVAGKSTFDPFGTIGKDVYHLKLSPNKKVLYGKTETDGTNLGLIYGIAITEAEGEKAITALDKAIGN